MIRSRVGYGGLEMALVCALCLFGALCLRAPQARAQKPNAAASKTPKPSPAVRALMERAAKEPQVTAAKTLDEAARIAENAGDFASLREIGVRNADPAKARRILERTVALQEKAAPDSLDLAWTLLYLGELIRDRQGKAEWPAARAIFERVLAIRQKRAPKSIEVQWTLGALAGGFWKYGDKKREQETFQRALRFAETLAPGSADMAQSFDGFGSYVQDVRGDRPAAKVFFERALAIRQKIAPQSQETARSLTKLGVIAADQGDLAAAESYFQRALTIQEKQAPDSLEMADALYYLGDIKRRRGDLTAAKAFLQRSLTIQEKLAPGSLPLAGMLTNLGVIVQYEGDLAGARALFQRALTIQEKQAPDSLGVALSLNCLGNVAHSQGDLAAAKQYQERALAIQEKRAPNSLDVAGSLNNLGNVADSQGDLAGAKDLYQRALAIFEKRAPNSLDVAGSLNNLGALQDETGDTQGALDSLRHALKIIDERAPDSLLAPFVLRQLAQLALASGDEAQAKAYLKRANTIDERVKSLPRDPAASSAQPAGTSTATRPETRFLTPAENTDVKGNEVEVRVAFLAPIPLARYRLWINGRPFGGDKGFDLPLPDEKGRLLEKGRVLEKGRILEKGRLLEKGEDRAALAKELPPEVAELVGKPQYAHFQQLRLTLPIEDTDGANVRIAIAAETTGGSVSDRQILHLRNPKAEQNRGSLRVLAIGVSAYQNLPKLGYAHRDALEMGDALRAQAGDGKLYKGVDITVVTDAEATLARVQQALDQFTTNVRPGDTLILALSGHGLKKGDASYFAPVRVDPENVEGTGLPWKDVLAKLQQARKTARSVWVLADCCRAAPGLRRETVATATDLKRGVDEGGNLVICTASSGDTPSYESEDLKHGIFTQAWLEALRGDAPALVYEDVARGRVLTLSGLQFAVDASVRRYARKEGVRQAVEFPRLEGSFSPSQPLFMPTPK